MHVVLIVRASYLFGGTGSSPVDDGSAYFLAVAVVVVVVMMMGAAVVVISVVSERVWIVRRFVFGRAWGGRYV